MESLNEDVAKLKYFLEKFRKVIIHKLRRRDEIKVIEELQWLDEYLINVFELRDENFNKFKRLLDPHNIFAPPVEIPDFDEIDWSKAKISFTDLSKKAKSASLKSLRRYPIERYKIMFEKDLFDKIIEVLISIWEVSTDVKLWDISHISMYIIGNVYSHVINSNNKKINGAKMLKEYSAKINTVLSNLLAAKTQHPKYDTLIKYLFVDINLDHFFEEDFPLTHISIVKSNLFTVAKSLISNDDEHLVINLVTRMVQGGYLPPPSSNVYTNIDRLVHKDPNLSFSDKARFKKEISDTCYYRSFYIYTENDYRRYIDLLNNLESRLINVIDNKNKLSDFFKEQRSFTIRTLKYHQIQIALIQILSYSIFREKPELVEKSYDFNQPTDSDSIWSSPNIVPSDLHKILSIVILSDEIEDEIMFDWEDRHGIRLYLSTLLIFLFSKLSKKDSSTRDSLLSQMRTFLNHSIRVNNDPNSVYAIKIKIERLLNNDLGRLSKSKHWPFERNNDELVDSTRKLLEDLVDALEKNLEHQEVERDISKEVIDSFGSQIINDYEEKAFFHNLIQKHGKIETLKSKDKEIIRIGINDLINRSVLIEGWYAPTYGLVESLARALSEQEDTLLGIHLKNKISKLQNINEEDIPDILNKELRKDDIIIFRNLYPNFQAFKDFSPFENSIQTPLDNHVIGLIKKKNLIYHYHSFGAEKMFILKNDLGSYLSIEEESFEKKGYHKKQGFYLKMVDFAKEKYAVKSFLDNSPDWLDTKFSTDEEKLNYVKGKLWIRIFKSFAWNFPNDFYGTQYVISRQK